MLTLNRYRVAALVLVWVRVRSALAGCWPVMIRVHRRAAGFARCRSPRRGRRVVVAGRRVRSPGTRTSRRCARGLRAASSVRRRRVVVRRRLRRAVPVLGRGVVVVQRASARHRLVAPVARALGRPRVRVHVPRHAQGAVVRAAATTADAAGAPQGRRGHRHLRGCRRPGNIGVLRPDRRRRLVRGCQRELHGWHRCLQW